MATVLVALLLGMGSPAAAAAASTHASAASAVQKGSVGKVGATDIGPLTNPDRTVDSNDLAAVGSTLYFARKDSAHGIELWAANDGTTAIVADIRTGKKSSKPRGLVAGANALYFFATGNDGVEGLWMLRVGSKSPESLAAVAPNPGAYSNITTVTAVIGKYFYFTGVDVQYGNELWVTDGTAAGTRMVADINKGSASSDISNLTVVGKRVFFYADDARHGRELWVSDGTTSGTHLVKDMAPGKQSGSGAAIMAAGNLAVFSAYRQEGAKAYLWVSDGTAQGTKLLRTDKGKKVTGIFLDWWVADGKAAYFTVVDGSSTGQWLYRSNGKPQGTKLVSAALDPEPANISFGLYDMVAYPGGIIFEGYHPRYGMETWTSDGTAKGTRLLKDMIPGAWDTNAIYPGSPITGVTSWPGFVTHGKWVYFQAPYKVGSKWSMQLARTDGKTVQRLTHFPAGKQLQNITVAGNSIYFSVSTVYTGAHRELWILG